MSRNAAEKRCSFSAARKGYICNQVLGTSLELVDEVKDGTMLEFDDFSLFVNVIKD